VASLCVFLFFVFLFQLVMATFDVSEFVANPSLAQLDAYRKKDLNEVASFYGITVSAGLRKAELRSAVVSGLVEKGIINLSGSASAPGVAGDGVASQPVAPVGSTPIAQGPHGGKPMTLPQFDPLSVESSEGSKQGARLKVRLARLQVEKEERDREFHLR